MERRSDGKASKAAVVLLEGGKAKGFDGSGNPAPIVSRLLEKGFKVLLPDVRLEGELEREWERNALAWGRPEAGMAADDARWAGAYLKTRRDIDNNNIILFALGKMSVPAVLACVLESVKEKGFIFKKCICNTRGMTYRTHPLHDRDGYYAGTRPLRSFELPCIPRILDVGDIPELKKASKIPILDGKEDPL